MLLLESACIAVPTFSEQWRTGRHEGLIMDSVTRTPIEGARVHIQFYPETSAISDEKGRFTVGPILKRVKTLLLLAPAERACTDVLQIEHAGYDTVTVRKVSSYDRSGNCKNVHFYSEVRMKKSTSNSGFNGDARKASAH
jgi:hypothetical protein